MVNQEINVDQVVTIGKEHLSNFESQLPEAFHKPIRSSVVLFSANKKSVVIDGHQVYDTGIFYARALALKASGRDDAPSISDMLETELSTIATAMFEDSGTMRSTNKSVLKKELAVERSGRGFIVSAFFLDGCVILWVVPYPPGNATVQDYINAFRKVIRRYQDEAQVYLIFDR